MVSLVFPVGLVTIVLVKYHLSPWRNLPPGPSGLPLLGNLFELKETMANIREVEKYLWCVRFRIKTLYQLTQPTRAHNAYRRRGTAIKCP